MAEVVQCDVCEKLAAPEKTKHVRLEHKRSLRVFNVTCDNYLSIPDITKKDLCNSCYEKLKLFLGGKADVIARETEATE